MRLSRRKLDRWCHGFKGNAGTLDLSFIPLVFWPPWGKSVFSAMCLPPPLPPHSLPASLPYCLPPSLSSLILNLPVWEKHKWNSTRIKRRTSPFAPAGRRKGCEVILSLISTGREHPLVLNSQRSAWKHTHELTVHRQSRFCLRLNTYVRIHTCTQQ